MGIFISILIIFVCVCRVIYLQVKDYPSDDPIM